VAADELKFGQPLFETHPHLLRPGESMRGPSINPSQDVILMRVVTPGIKAIEYYQRRQKLAELLPQNSVAILAAGDVRYRPGSSAVFYNFYQDPDFLYLTGSVHFVPRTLRAQG
jgi:intermediate cleaving peptidase 55